MNMKHYNILKKVPLDALKTIKGGRMNGKSDISPQWRIEAMTQEFGVCGIGWKHEIVKTWTQETNDNQIMVFVEINLYIKDGEMWSAPIPAIGGDFIVKKENNGMYANDESYKMAVTDALGVAMKFLGVAADVYRGLANDSKYGREQQQQSTQTNVQTNTQKTATSQATKPQSDPVKITDTHIKSLTAKYTKEGLTAEDFTGLIGWKYGVKEAKELVVPQFAQIMNSLHVVWGEYVAELSKAG